MEGKLSRFFTNFTINTINALSIISIHKNNRAIQYKESQFSLGFNTSYIFTGAKKSGAKGFFKGMGKGLVGVVAKPVGGVVDFASSTLEGIKGYIYSSIDREQRNSHHSDDFFSKNFFKINCFVECFGLRPHQLSPYRNLELIM